MRDTTHQKHAFCGRICLPRFLYDEFQACLGEKSGEFDLLTWVVEQDRAFSTQYGVIAEPNTAWRDAFRVELAARGWAEPRKRSLARVGASPNPIAALAESTRYVVPCPHVPCCPNTRRCCLRQDVERIGNVKLKPAGVREEREWYR